MTTIAVAPRPVPTGALIIFSDGTVGSVPSGSIGIPTAALGIAGFTAVPEETVRASSILADADMTISLAHNPIVPASLSIASNDMAPLIVTEDGEGGFTGDIGAGSNDIELETGRGTVSFNDDAAGPFLASYEWLGTGRGTVFTFVGPDDTPLGQGTITLANGVPMVVDVSAAALDVVQYETVDIIVDPDPSAPGITLTDTNLDLETLERIAAQIIECSALWQHEIRFIGKNVPWIRRADPMEITDLHDENGDLVDIPPFLMLNLDLEYNVAAPAGITSVTRDARGWAWTVPDLPIPGDEPDAIGWITGDAQEFTEQGIWQPNTSYDEFDAVRAGPTLVNTWYVAILQDRGSSWSFPALSGALNPLAPHGLVPALSEGNWIPDRDIRGWLGVADIVTLTGSVSGQSLLVHDRSGVAHYLTYYPASGRWTDTPAPPG